MNMWEGCNSSWLAIGHIPGGAFEHSAGGAHTVCSLNMRGYAPTGGKHWMSHFQRHIRSMVSSEMGCSAHSEKLVWEILYIFVIHVYLCNLKNRFSHAGTNSFFLLGLGLNKYHIIRTCLAGRLHHHQPTGWVQWRYFETDRVKWTA